MDIENKASSFLELIGLTVEQVTDMGITAKAKLKKDFCNTYSSAHGGYVYSLGHTAAALSAQLCLNRQAVVVDVANQYESSLMISPAKVKTQLLRAGKEIIVYRVQVRDGKGKLCLTQTVTLKEVDYPKTGLPEFKQTVIPGDENSPIDPVTGIYYPRISVFFAEVCHVYVLGRGEKGMIYGGDIYPDTANDYGAAHGGMIYTACDSVTGGSAAFLLEKKPVTVSSSIHYLRSAMVGPIKAEARLIRDGKQLLFYDVDVTDGNDELVAVAQFVLQSVDYKVTNQMKPEYRNKAFKE
jgi:acyl-CoA thioesterase